MLSEAGEGSVITEETFASLEDSFASLAVVEIPVGFHFIDVSMRKHTRQEKVHLVDEMNYFISVT